MKTPIFSTPASHRHCAPNRWSLLPNIRRDKNSSRWFLSSSIPVCENGDQRETFPGSPNLIFIFTAVQAPGVQRYPPTHAPPSVSGSRGTYAHDDSTNPLPPRKI
ncbi:uncharacterized protein CLUP02_04463 [Colletotrichum lupini]|uniref:Uncharacterized protein n=1 Tax=Colletotrichum lupini TaxID=145971 RepID=A0A9Q8WD52_9PEZI|nr:uncharacterized protein CLUP02_04463 [Colletotrichum lupini]UQC78984.1 hypothetical protein CLUP02_04463 [Colletotrichum lupini]